MVRSVIFSKARKGGFLISKSLLFRVASHFSGQIFQIYTSWPTQIVIFRFLAVSLCFFALWETGRTCCSKWPQKCSKTRLLVNDPGRSNSANNPGRSISTNNPGRSNSANNPGRSNSTNNPGWSNSANNPGRSNSVSFLIFRCAAQRLLLSEVSYHMGGGRSFISERNE